ncbi:hypothetical protein INT44_007941 [Umbelopsis vinacea]|uniref:Uncharacterized protein n=1 Tax=Umbelopsis vinacea TaxID=44442 RepID=A0A8H7PP99_9FUNG|nr:hypothetical protein INT44_007941 [Umbelopsis vinacea]
MNDGGNENDARISEAKDEMIVSTNSIPHYLPPPSPSASSTRRPGDRRGQLQDNNGRKHIATFQKINEGDANVSTASIANESKENMNDPMVKADENRTKRVRKLRARRTASAMVPSTPLIRNPKRSSPQLPDNLIKKARNAPPPPETSMVESPTQHRYNTRSSSKNTLPSSQDSQEDDATYSATEMDSEDLPASCEEDSNGESDPNSSQLSKDELQAGSKSQDDSKPVSKGQSKDASEPDSKGKCKDNSKSDIKGKFKDASKPDMKGKGKAKDDSKSDSKGKSKDASEPDIKGKGKAKDDSKPDIKGKGKAKDESKPDIKGKGKAKDDSTPDIKGKGKAEDDSESKGESSDDPTPEEEPLSEERRRYLETRLTAVEQWFADNDHLMFAPYEQLVSEQSWFEHLFCRTIAVHRRIAMLKLWELLCKDGNPISENPLVGGPVEDEPARMRSAIQERAKYQKEHPPAESSTAAEEQASNLNPFALGKLFISKVVKALARETKEVEERAVVVAESMQQNTKLICNSSCVPTKNPQRHGARFLTASVVTTWTEYKGQHSTTSPCQDHSRNPDASGRLRGIRQP